jgi:ribosomal protein S18 acetylase RimI-like enzyme
VALGPRSAWRCPQYARLLGDVLANGERAGPSARFHVERHSPALSLYKRLGFHKIGESGVYYLLKWSPEESGRE